MSYASWPVSQVVGTLVGGVAGEAGFAPVSEANGLGSLLDPLDDMLTAAIQVAAESVNRARSGDDVLRFHNLFVAYQVVALLAATGGRPIRDPFERYAHFSMSGQCVFLADKLTGGARSGRLLPVPAAVTSMVSGEYLRHLQLVADAIRGIAPALATEIGRLCDPDAEAQMPFFFLLGVEKGQLVWKSVSESEIDDFDLFDWPLPLNLFRHRLAIRLRLMDVDPEIIDALLGHAELGSATHGDESFRIWNEDMDRVRGPLNELFARLGFPPARSWDRAPEMAARPEITASGHGIGPTTFGSASRAQARRANQRQAVREARAIIRETLQRRSLGDLGDEEVTKLAGRLVRNGKGLPHAYGYLRYACLLKQAERVRRVSGRRIRFRRRYLATGEGMAPFNELAPRATTLYEKAMAWLEETSPRFDALRPGKRMSAALAVVGLVLESRITDPTLLQRALHGTHCRLVVKNDRAYLEYWLDSPEEGNVVPDIPVRRYPVSPRVAWLLDRSVQDGNVVKADAMAIPPILAGLAVVVRKARLAGDGMNLAALVDALARIVDQVNAMTLPGVVAGYLGGRVESYSLYWHEWLRVRWGEYREIPERLDMTTEPDAATVPGVQATRPASHLLQEDAERFLSAVRGVLVAAMEGGPRAVDRRALQAAIRKELSTQGHALSSSIQALASWTIHLLGRSKGRQKLAPGSVLRYFTALAGVFERVAYDVDLAACDEDELTQLYDDLLGQSTARDLHYVSRRVIEFHRWARGQYGLSEPDWSELPHVDARVSVDAGVITEGDYLRAHQVLEKSTGIPVAHVQAAGFLLICAHRFGLRKKEALGLTRADWVAIGDAHTVLVRDNPLRRLKRTSSRRLVPLVYGLTREEREIVRKWLGRAEAVHGDNLAGALFCNDDGSLQDWRPIVDLAMAALKLASGNPASTLHRARHGAANRVMCDLLGRPLQHWAPLWAGNPTGPDAVADLLLGSQGATRRAPWALARYMGHGRPGTALRSYLHFLGDMVEERIPLNHSDPSPIERLTTAVRLEEFAAFCPVVRGLHGHAQADVEKPTVAKVLGLMRLLARGRDVEQAAGWLSVEANWAREVVRVCTQVGDVIRLSPKGGRPPSGDPLEYLTRLREDAWARLLAAASTPGNPLRVAESGFPPAGQLAWMVGPTRQVVAVKDGQFALLKSVLAFWQIPVSRYLMLVTGESAGIEKRAAAHGFSTVHVKEGMSDGKQRRVDPARTDEDGALAPARCGCVFLENDAFTIRNSIEFVVAFLAYALAVSAGASFPS